MTEVPKVQFKATPIRAKFDEAIKTKFKSLKQTTVPKSMELSSD